MNVKKEIICVATFKLPTIYYLYGIIFAAFCGTNAKLFPMKNYKIFLLLLVFFGIQSLSAQNTDSKFHFYGGFGLSFDGNGFQFSIQPGAIYDINDTFKAGAGVQYAYGNSSSQLIGGDYSYNILGFNFLGLAYPTDEVELSTEYENLYVTENYNNLKTKYWSPALFVGAGYKFKNVAVGFKYNFLHEEGRSIYHDAFVPYIRIYF